MKVRDRLDQIERGTAREKSEAVYDLLVIFRELLTAYETLAGGVLGLCNASISGTQPRMIVSVSDLRELLEKAMPGGMVFDEDQD
jgi:hypothetical protein